VFWFWDENKVNNILMVLVVARQSRIFSASHTGLTSQVHWKLGGDTARTADPN